MKNFILIMMICSSCWMGCEPVEKPVAVANVAGEVAPEPAPYAGTGTANNNILFAAKSNAYAFKIFTDLRIKEQHPKEHLLLLVCTERDCSTCINEQLTFLTRAMKKEILDKQVILVTTAQQLAILNTTWSTVLQQMQVELKTVDQLQSIYQYHQQPIYYLLSAKKQVCLHAFQVDPGATAFTKEMVQLYHTLYFQ